MDCALCEVGLKLLLGEDWPPTWLQGPCGLSGQLVHHQCRRRGSRELVRGGEVHAHVEARQRRQPERERRAEQQQQQQQSARLAPALAPAVPRRAAVAGRSRSRQQPANGMRSPEPVETAAAAAGRQVGYLANERVRGAPGDRCRWWQRGRQRRRQRRRSGALAARRLIGGRLARRAQPVLGDARQAEAEAGAVQQAAELREAELRQQVGLVRTDGVERGATLQLRYLPTPVGAVGAVGCVGDGRRELPVC